MIEYLYSSGHEDEHDAMYEATTFAIKGTNLATATECELTFKDRNGKEHSTAFVGADGDFNLPGYCCSRGACPGAERYAGKRDRAF